MPATTRPTGDSTRDRLLHAAERLFARCGVAGARTREITEAAGAANSSALHYHFGSRDGLLQAVVSTHQHRVEQALAPALDRLAHARSRPSLADLVPAYVDAEASELAHDGGRNCLRIVAQLSHETGIRDGRPHPALRGTGLWRLFTLVLAELVTAGVPEPLARERVELMVMLVGAAFADRARRLQSGRPQPVDDPAYRADLAAMVLAMLQVPAPAG